MASWKPPAQLKRVQASDVERWLHDAWPRQPHYPDPRRCDQLAFKVNAIVDRHSAGREGGQADEAIRRRRQDHLTAAKHARALSRALQRTLQHLDDEQKMWTDAGLKPRDDALEHSITVSTRTLTAVETFLALPPPARVQDHSHHIDWIAKAARVAWSDLTNTSNDGKKIPFGVKPDSPLTIFVRSALEAIGLASEGLPGNTVDTISDHLRKRHDRPRLKRGSGAAEGEK